jgi:hypothetical protein
VVDRPIPGKLVPMIEREIGLGIGDRVGDG